MTVNDYDTQPTSIQPIERSEHRQTQGIGAKAVTPYQWDSLNNILTPGGAGFLPYAYDYMAASYGPNSDTYQFYQGGPAGSLVETLTIVYTDSSKSKISTVQRS